MHRQRKDNFFSRFNQQDQLAKTIPKKFPNCQYFVPIFNLQNNSNFLPPLQSCGSGIRCLFDPWIRDTRWVIKPKSWSGMNIPDNNSKSLEKIFLVQILKFFYADPLSGIFLGPGIGSRIRNPGEISRILNTAILFILRNRKTPLGIHRL
jgi:hypothetical protein